MRSLFITLIVIGGFLFLSQTKVFASYKFPWIAGYGWTMTQGWHCGAYDINNNCLYNRAIDVGSSENRFVIASDDEVVTNICTVGTYTVNVTVRNPNDSNFVFSYLHIDKTSLENNIVVNATIKQGQVIGITKAGNFSDSCGTANQGSSFGHIHWTFADSSGNWGIGRTIAGWTLCSYNSSSCDGATTKFTNGASTVGVNNGVLISDNQLLITGSTVTTTKDYVTKQGVVVTPTNGSVVLAPTSDQGIKLRVE